MNGSLMVIEKLCSYCYTLEDSSASLQARVEEDNDEYYTGPSLLSKSDAKKMYITVIAPSFASVTIVRGSMNVNETGIQPLSSSLMLLFHYYMQQPTDTCSSCWDAEDYQLA